MDGADDHHVDEACGLKKKRLFNLLNCLLLAEKEPATMTKLEEAFFEMEGSRVPHSKVGFSSSKQLVAAWFDRAWFRGQVVIVPVFTDQVSHLYSPECWYRLIWRRLLKTDSWVPSLFLASASVVAGSLEPNLKEQGQAATLYTLGLPATVSETMQEILTQRRPCS